MVLIVLGIVVVGFGTFLIYLGGSKGDEERHRDISSKIQETQDQIEQLKSDPGVDRKEIKDIESEFSSWASKLVEGKEQKKLELEKVELSSKQDRAELTSIWRPRILLFFDRIQRLIEAYNLKSGESITCAMPPLPSNLFGAESGGYTAKIFFREDIVWVFSFIPADALAKDAMASFQLKMYKSRDIRMENQVDFISIELGDGRIAIHVHENNRFNFSQIPESYAQSDTVLIGVANDLIENQLVQM